MPPLIFAILSLLYISALGLLAQRLRPLARKLLIALTAIEIIIAVVYLAGWTKAFPFWDWFLDPLGGEQNAPATFSATQLVTTGLIAALHIFATSRWQQRYWLLLTLAFLFMGLDEYYMFHEPIYNWEYGYAGLGISIVLSTIVMFWFVEKNLLLLTLLVGGLALMAGGGILIEDLVVKQACYQLLEFDTCQQLQIVEELGEMCGVTLILIGLINYTQTKHPHYNLPLSRLLTWGTAMALLWFNFAFWLLPAVEASLIAHPAQVAYLNGNLTLVAYNISDAYITENTGQFTVTLYWRTERGLAAEYGVSTHLLTHPDINSLTQNDVLQLNPPHTAWLPGQIIKQRIDLAVPPTLDTSRNYGLTVTVWERPWYEFNKLKVTTTDRAILTPDTVILQDIIAHSP
ncbi:MAG: hypothetical protein K8R89_00940 [Anaerolineae bacterium]|nr:hypothetical protein [Anaerolineae bacterium]